MPFDRMAEHLTDQSRQAAHDIFRHVTQLRDDALASAKIRNQSVVFAWRLSVRDDRRR